MKIIKITANDNGSHNNQTGELSTAPDGFAVIPADMAIPNTFPFVNLTIENDVVTAMTANETAYQAYIDSLPQPEPEQPTEEDITLEMLADHEERICMMEIMA